MPQLARHRKESPVETSASLRLRSNDRTRPCGGIRNLEAWTTPSSGAVSPCCLRSLSLQGGEDVTTANDCAAAGKSNLRNRRTLLTVPARSPHRVQQGIGLPAVRTEQNRPALSQVPAPSGSRLPRLRTPRQSRNLRIRQSTSPARRFTEIGGIRTDDSNVATEKDREITNGLPSRRGDFHAAY
jgi:hypothetical protein